MSIVYGKIDSLKQIREVLSEKGIARFNSIKDLQKFIKNYEREKEEIFNQVAEGVDGEINELQTLGHTFQKKYDLKKEKIVKKLNREINSLKSKCVLIQAKSSNHALIKAFNFLRLKIHNAKKALLEKNFNRITRLYTYKAKQKVDTTIKKINEYTSNRNIIIDERCSPKFNELAHMKEVVDELQPLIAGAIGENLVVKELEKLSDDHILINDFSLTFDPPIYYRKENERIFSIQIDHLLITKAGIFNIETKNWSKNSMERFDMRSPVEQIQRTSYALFIMLNSDSNRSRNGLNWHHWGKKQIPIRNIVVMIKQKPKEQFKFVTIKTLKELNPYITYFEPIFTDLELQRITNRLLILNN